MRRFAIRRTLGCPGRRIPERSASDRRTLQCAGKRRKGTPEQRNEPPGSQELMDGNASTASMYEKFGEMVKEHAADMRLASSPPMAAPTAPVTDADGAFSKMDSMLAAIRDGTFQPPEQSSQQHSPDKEAPAKPELAGPPQRRGFPGKKGPSRDALARAVLEEDFANNDTTEDIQEDVTMMYMALDALTDEEEPSDSSASVSAPRPPASPAEPPKPPPKLQAPPSLTTRSAQLAMEAATEGDAPAPVRPASQSAAAAAADAATAAPAQPTAPASQLAEAAPGPAEVLSARPVPLEAPSWPGGAANAGGKGAATEAVGTRYASNPEAQADAKAAFKKFEGFARECLANKAIMHGLITMTGRGGVKIACGNGLVGFLPNRLMSAHKFNVIRSTQLDYAREQKTEIAEVLEDPERRRELYRRGNAALLGWPIRVAVDSIDTEHSTVILSERAAYSEEAQQLRFTDPLVLHTLSECMETAAQEPFSAVVLSSQRHGLYVQCSAEGLPGLADLYKEAKSRPMFRGFVHWTEITWEPKGSPAARQPTLRHPRGSKVDVKLLDVNVAKGWINMSIRQCDTDPALSTLNRLNEKLETGEGLVSEGDIPAPMARFLRRLADMPEVFRVAVATLEESKATAAGLQVFMGKEESELMEIDGVQTHEYRIALRLGSQLAACRVCASLEREDVVGLLQLLSSDTGLSASDTEQDFE